MYDYHMHSAFSSDTDVPMEDMIHSAISKGLTEICFTDHIDYDYASPEIAFEFDVDEYKAKIEAMKQKYQSQISIQLGLEIGIQPHILEKCKTLVEHLKPDFIIASQHTIGRQDLYLGDFYKNRTPEEALHYGMNELLEMVTKFDAFCVIGHIDILKRYNDDVRALPKELYVSEVEPVLKALIAKNKGIEVNTSGIRQGLNETLPTRLVLEKYFELGGRIITTGADSHKPEDVGHSFREVLLMLSDIGFKAIYRFDQMVPQSISIESLLNA